MPWQSEVISFAKSPTRSPKSTVSLWMSRLSQRSANQRGEVHPEESERQPQNSNDHPFPPIATAQKLKRCIQITVLPVDDLHFGIAGGFGVAPPGFIVESFDGSKVGSSLGFSGVPESLPASLPQPTDKKAKLEIANGNTRILNHFDNCISLPSIQF
jgi:hypothetical protein